MKYQDENSKIIDKWVEEGWEWGIPLSHEEFLHAKQGNIEVLLTPTVKVPKEWFGNIKNKKILGLASGGGQQMPVFVANGAICTVLDNSIKQLESEIFVSKRENYDIEIIKADMTLKLPFEDETFDIIFHPVSNCYVEDVVSIFKECYRVLKKGGVLLSGLGNEINYITSDELTITNKMPFNPLINKEYEKELLEDDSGYQFSHTLEEQITGQLKAGFILEDLYEDTNGSGRLHDLNIKTFFATKSRKKGEY